MHVATISLTFLTFYWLLEFKCYSNLRASMQIKHQVFNSDHSLLREVWLATAEKSDPNLSDLPGLVGPVPGSPGVLPPPAPGVAPGDTPAWLHFIIEIKRTNQTAP